MDHTTPTRKGVIMLDDDKEQNALALEAEVLNDPYDTSHIWSAFEVLKEGSYR